MNAVRSEVDELKERIVKLEEIIAQLQSENEFFRYLPFILQQKSHQIYFFLIKFQGQRAQRCSLAATTAATGPWLSSIPTGFANDSAAQQSTATATGLKKLPQYYFQMS